MEVLKVEHLFAGYGKQCVVEDVSFSVRKGEIAGIFGENGCGKTTLLKAVAGLGTGMAGSVLVNGQDTGKLTPRRRAGYLALFSAGTELPKGLLAEEVLETGWYARLPFLGLPGEGMRRVKEQVIAKLELEPFISCYYDRLSQGQKQRVLLGRLLLQNAPVFLMDEPDTALDFRHKHSLLQTMRSIVREKQKAGVMILHDPTLALTYCDRVFLMKKGKMTDVICPAEETEQQIAEKIKEITGKVVVTKHGTSVIISPEFHYI